MERLLIALGRCAGGDDGLREWAATLGWDYAASFVPIMGDDDRALLREPCRRVATLCEGAVSVLHFPLRAGVSVAEGTKLIGTYRARFPHCLAVFSGSDRAAWHLAATCRDASGSSAVTPLFSWSLADLTKIVLQTLAQLSASGVESATDAPAVMERWAHIITAGAVNAMPVSKPHRDTFTADTVQWWCNQMGKRDFLSHDAERDLAKRAATGDNKARETLFLKNRRLAVYIAHKYANRGLDLSDLIQEANVGLLHAIDLFDERKGFRLTTYATYWIRQLLGRAIENHGRTIRLPSHIYEKVRLVNQAVESIGAETEAQAQATNEEIARETNLPVRNVALLRGLPYVVSLDAPATDGEQSMVALMPDAEPRHVPYARVFRRALREEIGRALKQLTPREREVLELRYGLFLDAEAPMTLEQVGKELHLSRERARQIEAGALQKLRRSEISGRLRETVVSGGADFYFDDSSDWYSFTEPETAPLPQPKIPLPQQEPATDTAAPVPVAAIAAPVVLPKPELLVLKRPEPPQLALSFAGVTISVATVGVVSQDTIAPVGFSCRSCAAPVELKPSFGGASWYRCASCGDKRVLSAAALAGGNA